MTPKEYRNLSPAEREEYNEQRLQWINSGLLIRTPDVAAVIKSVRHLVIKNSHGVQAPRGLIVSGPPTIGKTTAARATGLTIERRAQSRNVSTPAEN